MIKHCDIHLILMNHKKLQWPDAVTAGADLGGSHFAIRRVDGDGMKTRDYFKALAQSFFLDRAWVGLALLAGVAAFSPEAALMAVAGSLLALLAAWQTTLPWTLREFGLIPLNGFFLGLGLYAYFPDTIQTWIYLAIGAFLIPTAASGLTAALAPFRL